MTTDAPPVTRNCPDHPTYPVSVSYGRCFQCLAEEAKERQQEQRGEEPMALVIAHSTHSFNADLCVGCGVFWGSYAASRGCRPKPGQQPSEPDPTLLCGVCGEQDSTGAPLIDLQIVEGGTVYRMCPDCLRWLRDCCIEALETLVPA